jgi:DNA-binding transcriptional LysR family regulator
MALAPIIAQMAVRHPKVTIELIVEDALSDIVADGHDAGVRLGEMIAADMIAVRLTPPITAILCAAPSYLVGRTMPASLTDLESHNLIGLRFSPHRALYDWDVRDGRADVTIRTSGNAVVPDPLSARDLALAGVGIAYLYEPIVRADLASGRLVQVLPEAAMEEPGLFLYFPRLASSAPKLRAFLDTARLLRQL